MLKITSTFALTCFIPGYKPHRTRYDELGRGVRSNHQMNALNDSNMHLCWHYIRIHNVLIQRYVNSMRRRILLSIRKNEGHTGY